MVYSNVKKDLVTINSVATDPEFKHLNMSRFKLQKLEKEGFITIKNENNTPFVSISEIKKYIKIESEIQENYLSIHSFIEQVFHVRKNGKITHYKEGLIKNKDLLLIDFKVFRNKEYIKKIDMLRFLEEFIHRDDILKQLNLSLHDYHMILRKTDINEVKITIKNPFISISDFNILKQAAVKYNTTSNEFTWLIGARVVKDVKYSHVAKKVETLIKIAKLGHFKYFFDTDNKFFVEEKSFVKYAKLVGELQQHYYKLTKVTRLFGIKQFTISQLQVNFIPNLLHICKSVGIKYKKFEIPIEREFIFIERTGLDLFFEKYISNNDIVQEYQITHRDLNYWVGKNNIKKLTFHYTLSYYFKQDIEHLFVHTPQLSLSNTEPRAPFKINSYYTLKEVKDILNANDTELQQIRKEENLDFLYYKDTTIYLKTDINQLKQLQEEAKIKYCTPQYLRNKGYSQHVDKYFTKYKTSYLIKIALNSKNRRSFVYLKSEVDAFIKEDTIKQQIAQLNYSKPTDSFLTQLDIYELTFPTNCWHTQNQWMSYCINKLKLSKAHKLTVEANVSQLVKCTRHLINSLGNQELYLKSSKEINLVLFNEQIPITHQFVLYAFINSYYNELKVNSLPTFNLKMIKNPYATKSKKKDKDIYEYEQYQLLFDYANNITLHKTKAINDAINKINDYKYQRKHNTLSKHYASSWLYILIHLNNAWRHKDVCEIPSVDLKLIHITSLEQFKNQELSIEDAQKVITQLIAKDLTVSKTQVTNRFFCSRDLTISLATAVIICQLVANECFPIRNHIIDFGNKHQHFTETAQKAFFKNFSDSQFIFENRKMNRTLLSFMYILLLQKGHGGAALEVAQRLRAHADFETTNIYIHIPERELDHLSRQLFQRKHFGYITNLFAEVLLGESNNREQRTHEITVLNEKFKDIYQIEATSEFINNVLSEKRLIGDMILNIGKEAVIDYLFKLNCNVLPSREEHIQCLVSETGCIYPAKSCKQCVYAIPNFYALSAITESISSHLKSFTEQFENTPYNTERIKLANLLYMEMDILHDACVSFGKEEVFQFFEKKQEGYFELLALLDNLELEKDIEEYLTYVPTTQYEL
ncbi:hypothetical protein EJ379_22750 [Bacillus cereus ATCC 14579]|nr:hypothetical protein EJ379_22750 [Bacillus cereus ATCC 14579]